MAAGESGDRGTVGGVTVTRLNWLRGVDMVIRAKNCRYLPVKPDFTSELCVAPRAYFSARWPILHVDTAQ